MGENSDSGTTIPVRRLHNYVYCPRLMYFQFVENVFVPNADVVEGKGIHQRVDKPDVIPEYPLEEDTGRKSIRSLALSDSDLGIHGVLDLLREEEEGWRVFDYKRGSPLRTSAQMLQPREADAVQLCAYVMLAEKNGWRISGGSIYYAETKQIVEVDCSDTLRETVRRTIQEVRSAIARPTPEPLYGDVRCLYCSLYPVCLPEESLFWKRQKKLSGTLRPPVCEEPGDEVLVIQSPDVYLARRGESLVATRKGKPVSTHPIHRIRSIHLFGGAQFSTQVLQLCLEHHLNLSFFSPAGKYLGRLDTLSISGLDSRHGQYRYAENPSLALPIIRSMIAGKIQNQRTILLRNSRNRPDSVVDELQCLRKKVLHAENRENLLGLEGRAAALYFASFPDVLKQQFFSERFTGRNRRPPRDPVNAMLSLGYSVLSSEISGICASLGLDPSCGLLHVPRFGRAALALDLMEEFRPLIVDSVVISLINRNEVSPNDFVEASTGCGLLRSGHRAFWNAYVRRMNEEVSHPVFHYRLSYRRMLEIQAAQLWRIFRGDGNRYFPMTTR